MASSVLSRDPQPNSYEPGLIRLLSKHVIYVHSEQGSSAPSPQLSPTTTVGMAQQQQILTQRIFLSGPQQWDTWLTAVKTQALAKEIWEFVNPDGKGPSEPITPPETTLESFIARHGISLPSTNASNASGEPAQGNRQPSQDDTVGPDTPDSPEHTPAPTPPPPAVSIADLNPTQLYEYKKEDKKWRTQVEKVEKQRKNLAELIHYILDRVSDDYRSRILNEQHPREMVRTLRKRVALSDRAKEIEVLNTWKWLRKTPKDTYLATWLRKWEETYEKAQELDLPEATGVRPVLDFIDAIEPIADKFHSYWSERIQDLQDEDRVDEIPDLYDILDKFRNRIRLRQLQKGKSASAFAAYQSTSADDNEQDKQDKQDMQDKQDKQDKKPHTHCFCGQRHAIDDCDHMHEQLRGKDWKEDSKRAELLQKAEKKPPCKRVIEGSRKRVSKKHKTASDQAKTATDDQTNMGKYQAGLASIALATVANPVRDSWVLDNAATDHVCNNIELLHDFRPSTAPNRLESGTQSLDIHGYGTAYVTVQTLHGPYKLRLNDVAYIPGYITNLVCFRRFHQKGIQWDTARSRLIDQDGSHVCSLLDRHGLWLLEYNPVANRSEETSGGGSPPPSPPLTPPSDVEQQSAMALATTFKRSRRSKPSRQPREAYASAARWHQRLGHVGPAVIDHLVRPAPEDDPKGRKTLNGVNITAWDAPATSKCEICAITKAHEIVSRRTPDTRSAKPFERVHLDVVPMHEAFDLSQYYVHVNCEYTSYRLIRAVHTKSAVPQAILDVLAYVRRRWSCEVAVIRTDGESTIQQGTNFEADLVAKGYHVERSPPDTQALNGKSERAGHVLIQRARGLKAQARFPDVLWPEIIVAAVYLLNHIPMESLGWLSPREFLQQELGRPHIPRLAHLFAYGSKAYWHKKNIPKLDRLEPNGGIGFLCGYQSSNIYRVWIPAERTIKPFRDVTFDEDQFYSPDDPDILEQIRQANEATPISTVSLIDSLDPKGEEEQQGFSTDESDDEFLAFHSDVDVNAREPAPGNLIPPMDLPTCPPDDDGIQFPLTPRPTPDRDEHAVQEQNDDGDTIVVMPRNPQDTTSVHSDSRDPPPAEPRQPRKTGKRDPAPRHSEISADVDRPELIIPQRTRGSKRKEAYALAVAKVGCNTGFHGAFAAGASQAYDRQHQSTLTPEPKNYKAMLTHPHSQQWLKATTEEFNKLLQNGTAQVVSIPDDVHWRDVLPMTWVWKYKVNEDGYLAKHKARLCVRGDLERLPSTEETFAATLAARVFRALMAIAAYFDLELQQLDAISAFTNSALRRKIYVRLPDGFHQPNKCLLLLRALYGLKESGHLWFKEFTGTLSDLGLRCSADEQCLWFNDWLVLFFFVDDVVAMFKSTYADKWDRFKADLCSAYEFKDLGDLKWFLGVRVIRNRPSRKLWLCQDAYIDKIISRFHLTQGRWATPMAIDELGAYYPDQLPSKQTIYGYQQLVGSLNYAAVITRADVARAASKLAEFLQSPALQHIKAAHRAIEYLAASSSLALEYSGPQHDPADAQNQDPFQVYSDASFGDCPRTRRSTGGFLVTLFGGAIDWRSKRQSCVTLSSTEAELHALTDAAREIQYWKRIFSDIRLMLDQEYSATCDNKQTIRLLTACTPQFNTKLRHVDIKHHWLREKVQDGEIAINWVATADMPADGFTKPLSVQQHRKLLKHLSLVDISGRLGQTEA